jgi:hypothetical protein
MMVSKEKLFSKLDLLEAELEERLIPHLENSALGNNDLVFCVTGFNPFKELKSKTDKVSEELVELGAQILVLKNKLGEPSDGSVAERICWYCRKWGNIENNQRNSAQELAKQFLKEITNRQKR